MNYLNIKSHLNIAIIFIFISTPIFSQTIETLIGKERFEIGIDRRFYKRDLQTMINSFIGITVILLLGMGLLNG